MGLLGFRTGKKKPALFCTVPTSTTKQIEMGKTKAFDLWEEGKGGSLGFFVFVFPAGFYALVHIEEDKGFFAFGGWVGW